MAAKSYMETDRQVRSLIEEAKAGSFKPVYLLMGEEPYYPDLLCYGADVDADAVITAALLGDRTAGEPDGTWSVIRYDRLNRVAKTLSSTHKGGRTMEDVEYTFRGSPLRRHIVHTDSLGYSFTEDYAYTYDHEERLLCEKHSLNRADSVVVVSNAYDSHGRLSSSGRAENPQLTTQYLYNIRSWTTGISSPYLTETLYYNTARPGASSPVQWGGNISSMAWEGSKAYDFTYDGLGRLTGASYVGDISKSRQYSYDAHGNITGVTEGSTPHAYTYTGNHLAGTQYDSNGNTTSDSVTGIVSARYNVLNLPEEIIKSNGDTVRYVYGAGGTKLRERVIPPSPSGSVTKTDYVGNLVYRDDQLGRILVDGGSIVAKDSTLALAYEFAFTDHLGSIRSLVTVGDSLFRKTEYGPYGEVLSENWTSLSASPGGGSGGNGGNGAGGEIEVEDEEEDDGGGGSRGSRSVSVIQTRLDNPYRYGGKERLDVSRLDLYDFGARQYAPALPRWLTMDPLAEKYYGVSPYAYCEGNPMNRVDPQGDTVAVLIAAHGAEIIAPFAFGHIGLAFVENGGKSSSLWSKNGDTHISGSDRQLGGDNDYGKPIESIRLFLDNPIDNSVDHQGGNSFPYYTEALIIPTTQEQDAAIRKTMSEEVNSPYNLVTSNCAVAVHNALLGGGVKTHPDNYHNDNPLLNIIAPFMLYQSIRQSNPNSYIIKPSVK